MITVTCRIRPTLMKYCQKIILAETMLKREGGGLATIIFLKYGKNDDP